jgi:uncharacterized membrane-anchored protein
MDLTRRTLVKVPEVTALFWVTKLLTTAMGESTSDYLVKRFAAVPAVLLGTVVLLAVLAFQVTRDRYRPWVYWVAVLMVAIVGTMAADVLHIQFGVPYAASSAFFAVVLAVVFVAWHGSRGRCRSTASTRCAGSSSTGRRSCPPSPWAPRSATSPRPP